MKRTLVIALMAFLGALYLARLNAPTWYPESASWPVDTPPRYLFDEQYTAFSAMQLAEGDDRFFEPSVRRYRYAPPHPMARYLGVLSRGEWSHPPGAPLVMAASIWLFGFHDWSVRLVALLAALATVVATARLAGRQWLLSVLLLTTDGMFFVFARTALPHMLATASLVMGTVALTVSKRHPTRGHLAAGGWFGFAMSVRWTTIPVCGAIFVAHAVSSSTRRRALVTAIGQIVMTALLVYLATYLPYFLHGHSLTEWWRLQGEMLWFHRHVAAPNAQASAWYSWPFAYRGVAFATGHTADRTWLVRAALSPLSWWPLPITILASIAALFRARKSVWSEGQQTSSLCVVALLAVWLPWAILSRQGMSYYLLLAAPFNALLLARALAALPNRLGKISYGYGVAAVASLLLFYPILSGLPLRAEIANAYGKVLLRGATTTSVPRARATQSGSRYQAGDESGGGFVETAPLTPSAAAR